MGTKTLKRELHKTIDTITDNAVLEAVYTLLKQNTEEEYNLTAAQKRELDQRLEAHKAGKLKYYTIDEVRKAVSNTRTR